jgi:hypothetical protein
VTEVFSLDQVKAACEIYLRVTARTGVRSPFFMSPITGILKIVPIERMNALLVVTPQPAYLEEVKKWIERLDRSSDTGGGRQPPPVGPAPAPGPESLPPEGEPGQPPMVPPMINQ